MASNKTTGTTNTVQDTKPYDPMLDRVPVTIPRTSRKQEDVFVGLNGKGYTIRPGETVMVPRPVADIIEESQRQQKRQADFIQQTQDEQRNRAKQYGLG